MQLRANVSKKFKKPQDKEFFKNKQYQGIFRVDDIKNFSRVAATKETSQDSPQESKVENFFPCSGLFTGDELLTVSNSKKNEIKNFSRISNIKNFSRIASIAAAFVLIFLFGRM